MNRLEQNLKAKKILLLDGAMGTMLWSKGLTGARCPEQYNLTNPDILKEIARDYLNAGSDIIQTNTFGGSSLKLAKYSLGEDYREINHIAVSAVRETVDGRALVSASCGPSGEILKPYGDRDPAELLESFARQAEVMIEAGADIIHIETMSDIQEALLALQAVREQNAAIPVMVSLTYNKIPRGFYTMMGTDLETAVKQLEDRGADVIGSNCGNGSDDMVLIAREIKAHTRLPVVIQPNAGIPELKGGETIYPESPEFMAERTGLLLEAGVSIVGGCCGSTPEHIARMRAVIDQRQQQCSS